MSDIDKRELFRSLVVNESLPGFNYIAQQFSFKTVFNRSAYHYCCCRCAFEHEFLLYISNTGEIDEDIYESVVQNIINGECPHVKTAAQEFLTETKVDAIHVAAARGNKAAVKWHLEVCGFDGHGDYSTNGDSIAMSSTGIFQLHPCDIAALKNKRSITKMYSKELANHQGPPVPFIRHLQIGSDTIIVDVLPKGEVLQRNVTSLCGNMRFLPQAPRFPARPKFIMRNPSGMTVARHRPQRMSLTRSDLSSAAQLQAMHSLGSRFPNPRFLQTTGPRASMPLLVGFKEQSTAKNDTCQANLPGDAKRNRDFENQIMNLSSLLLHHFDESTTEIIDALKNIPKEQRKASKNLNHYLTLPHIRVDFIKTILDIGANVNYIHTFGRTAIDTLLKVKPINDATMVREKVAVLVSENPDMKLHTKSVHRALKRDLQFQGRSNLQTFKSYELSGTYKADARHRGIFGFDDKEDFALNSMGPFLMECGFPVDRKQLEHFLSTEQVDPFCLHEAEIKYIGSFLGNPRSLIVACRDALRRHFKGRSIHHFVGKIDCPPKIKDIILMKSLLNTRNGYP